MLDLGRVVTETEVRVVVVVDEVVLGDDGDGVLGAVEGDVVAPEAGVEDADADALGVEALGVEVDEVDLGELGAGVAVEVAGAVGIGGDGGRRLVAGPATVPESHGGQGAPATAPTLRPARTGTMEVTKGRWEMAVACAGVARTVMALSQRLFDVELCARGEDGVAVSEETGRSRSSKRLGAVRRRRRRSMAWGS